MNSLEKIRSHDALVYHTEHRSEKGVRTVWLVCLSDGYLIDCGSDAESKGRANVLAAIINESGPEKLGHAALKATERSRSQTIGEG